MLIAAIHTLPHHAAEADQGLIKAYFQSSIHVLPWYFNYNLVSVYCEPGLRSFDKIVVIHFTVSKPWQLTGEWGCETWRTNDYCLFWKSLSLVSGNYTK